VAATQLERLQHDQLHRVADIRKVAKRYHGLLYRATDHRALTRHAVTALKTWRATDKKLSKTTSTYPGFIGRNRRYIVDRF